MAEETVDVGLNSGVTFTPEQEMEALRMSILYFLMFLDDHGVGLARYPSKQGEQVLFLSQPEMAVDDFVTKFSQYVDELSQPPAPEQDVVDQIMKMLALAGQEISEGSTETSEEVIEEAEEVLEK